MKIKWLLVLFLNITIAYSQQIKGNIIDAITNQPIAGATINIISQNLFYPADDTGKFNIRVNNSLANTDTINFSCVGYQSQKIRVAEILVNSIIKLNPLVTALTEVKIGINAPAIVKLGSRLKSGSNWFSFLPNMEVAMFMTGSANAKGVISSVGFYLGAGNLFSGNRGDVTAPFRIRLYEADSTSKPGEELIKDIIIVSAKKNNAWCDVDVSAYQITNPRNGFFVAFCLLDKNYYEVKRSYKQDPVKTEGNSKFILTPRLAFNQNEFKEGLSYRGINDHTGWRWNKGPYNYLIRAAIAPY